MGNSIVKNFCPDPDMIIRIPFVVAGRTLKVNTGKGQKSEEM